MLKLSQATRASQSAYILSGPEVDHHLHRSAALAQAVTPHLILASSQLNRLPNHQRRLIYLHEFAHLEQLARGGHDSISHLEAEAWQAAHCWSRGRSFTIRGRASAPLNALALIQGGSTGHPSAPPWYQANPTEPISASDSIVVKDVQTIDDMTLDSVLDAIISAQQTEIVVVCHGTDQGTTLRAYPGSTVLADRNVLLALASDHRGEITAFDGSKMVTPIKSDDSVKDLMRSTLARVDVLRKKMNRVRAMKLTHIAFRACDMGSSDDTMSAFLQFFGAASISAPTIEDTYGSFGTKATKDLPGWVKNQRIAHFHVFTDGKVAFATKWAGGIKYEIACRGSNDSAIVEWVKKHIVTGSFDAANVVYHGMKVEDPHLKLNDTNIYFIRDADFISRINFVKA